MLIQLLRFIDSVAVVATICATVLLAKSCLCVTEEDDEVLERSQLMDYYKKGLFILQQSEPLNRCITVDRSNPVLDDCEQPTRHMLWKWVSRHRLFNVGTSKCLGLNISDTTQPLGMFECDMSVPVLWWRCKGYMLYGASQWKVAVTGRLVVVKRNSYTEWRRFNTLKETPCSYPYEDIHTLLGNAHGMPCAFPFRYNNKWYYECTTEGREDHLLWCATSTRYDEAERWGFCPVQDSSCEPFWESNQELQACYQFNLYTILTWSQAMSTCQAQGGNLLSITSLAEHRYIRDRLASVGAMVWIGLNHLKDGQGWQWSDGAPLTLVNFTTALPASPLQDNRQCGVYNSAYEGHWQSLSCESALPYICKKMPNNTRRAEPLENWQYIHTECANGWWPHNGFCYRLMSETEAGSWEESSQACESQGANLTSIHSLSEVENLLNLLANFSGESMEVWIGLWKQESSPTVKWSDGSPVTLTLWHQYHPPNNLTDEKLCVKVDKKEGNWLLVSCDERLPAVCIKESQNRHLGTWDEGCPEGWKRHGHSCYTVTSHEHNFHDATQGYYCKAHLLQLENRFEQAFVNSLLSESGANSSMYYWIDLVDEGEMGVYSWPHKNGFSVPLTFSNWNKHQPVTAGSCVAMSGGHDLGRWEVKDCKSHKALSVCKQSISSYHEVQLPEHHIDAYTPCPPGWESHSGLIHCFKVFHDEKVLMKRSWVEADFFCQALGAQLASFHHYEEQVFVKQLLSTIFEGTEGRWFWIGLNKRDPDNPGGWEWSDGAPVLSSFIDDKNEEDDRRDCAVYSDLTDTIMPQPCDTKHEWICKLYRGDELKKPYWYTEQSEPWVFYRGAEYLLAKQPFDWDAVSLACQMMGAYLLSIHSKEEMHFIKERLRRLSLGPTDWWIGLSTGQPGDDVSWSDKTEVEFQNWAEGTAIIGPRKRSCVTMSSSSGKWSTNKCSDLHGYVCKRKTVSVVETPRKPCYIGGCPEKWLYFGHKCLLLHLPNSPKDGKSWNDAQSICSSFEGSLIAIEDEIEQAYITMLLQGSSVGVWIGLWDEDPDTWTSGKKVSYTNWSPVSPRSFLNDDEWVSRFANEQLCMVLSNNHNFHLTGKWYFERCSESAYGFVCQKPQDVSKPPAHSCRHLPDNIEYRSHTYKVVSGNMSWYDAMHMCTENDSDLVSVTDAYHQAFLTVLVNRLAVPHWIGLYSQDSGINYQWSDGSDTVYTHWDAADDDEDIVNGECVYMDVNGGWRRADCETPLPGALCHVSPAGIKPFISYELVCPSTWVKFGQGCYNFEPVVEKLTFEESREHCRQKVNTSDVLTIESETENRFVLEQLWSSGFHHHTVWLGMYFNFDTDSLAWVDGSPMEYTNWPSKAPDTKLLTADTCVNTRVVDGLWYLSRCTERLGFICKTITNVGTEVEVAPINGVYHGVIAAAVLVAVLVFALLAGAMWFMYKRNASRFQRLPNLGSAYYRQTSSQATESDGNVLITDLEAHSGE